MDKIIFVTIVGSLVCVVTGCSVPEGRFANPGMQDWVHYSDIVAVGTVTAITDDPSFFGDIVSLQTYGATVAIWCSYKGGDLPREISIGEAGAIPGMCFSKDLFLHQDYILFLQKPYGTDFYVQTQRARPASNVSQLVNVCDLDLTYPAGHGAGFDVCPTPTNTPDCLRYEEPSRGEWGSWLEEEVEE